MEKDPYFDIDDEPTDNAMVEGDEAEAVEEVAAELAPEPEPEAPAPEPAPSASQSIGGIPTPPEDIPLDIHAKSAAAGTQYPTEDPGDQHTVWSPSPGVIGSHAQGFRKVK